MRLDHKTQTALNRESGLVDAATPPPAVLRLNDAARRALAILAAGIFASFAATAICVALDVHDVLGLADLPTVQFLFPSLHITYFFPEPVERAQVIAFIAGACLMSLALVIFPKLDSRISKAAGRIFLAMFVLAIIGCFLLGRTHYQEPIRHFFTFHAAWRPESPTFWIAAFVAAVSPALFPFGKLRRAVTTLLAAVSVAALALLCLRYSFVAPADGLAWDIRNHHDSAALHSVVQSTFGQIPYFDFIPQYGGYGLFAIPFFRLGLDPWAALCLFLFSCTLVSFFSMGIAVAIASRSWQCGSLAGIVVFWLSGLAHAPYSYFQGAPVRIFFPSIFLLLFSLYTKSRRLVCAIGGFMIPFAIYWNPETGVVCLGAAASFLMFDIAVRRHTDGTFSAKALMPASIFLIACVCTAAVLEATAVIFLGRVVNVSDLFFHAALFSKFGYFNLPMPPLDVWVPAAFAFCLLLSFPSWVSTPVSTPVSNAGDSLRTRAFFGYFCAMLFSGLFLFYQGRSYTGNLVGFAFPIVCGGFSWLWVDSKPDAKRRAGGFSWTGNSIAIFGFAVASAALAGNPIFKSAPFLNPLAMTISADDQTLRTFIRKESQGHQGAFIVSPQAWRLHLLSGVAPPNDLPPQSALITRMQEEQTLKAALPDSGYALFVEPEYFAPQAYFRSPFPEILMARINAYWERGELLKLNSGEISTFEPKGSTERIIPRTGHDLVGIQRQEPARAP